MDNIYNPRNSNAIVTPGSDNAGNLGSSDISRILPRQLSTGSTRGTQTVGYGATKIDGSNNRITLGDGIILDGDNESITIENTSNPVITIGKYTDETFNFRVVDANGVGLAQFGQFPDRSIALKVAKPNIEVSTATASQLVFNSNASFTVALQSSYTFASFGSIGAGVLDPGSFVTIPHNVGFIPNVNCFGPQLFPGVTYPTVPAGFPLSDTTLLVSGSAIIQVADVSGNAFFNFSYTFDATNLYIGVTFQNGTTAPVTTLPLTIYYTIFTLNATNNFNG